MGEDHRYGERPEPAPASSRRVFCRLPEAVLVARMEDQTLDQAPIWDDLAGFDGRQWHGVVDLVIAGYPCQPFSVAGKRRGTDDPRHLWPHVARVIGECGPLWVFLENVPNHLNLGYREVREELEGLGYGVTEGLFAPDVPNVLMTDSRGPA